MADQHKINSNPGGQIMASYNYPIFNATKNYLYKTKIIISQVLRFFLALLVLFISSESFIFIFTCLYNSFAIPFNIIYFILNVVMNITLFVCNLFEFLNDFIGESLIFLYKSISYYNCCYYKPDVNSTISKLKAENKNLQEKIDDLKNEYDEVSDKLYDLEVSKRKEIYLDAEQVSKIKVLLKDCIFCNFFICDDCLPKQDIITRIKRIIDKCDQYVKLYRKLQVEHKELSKKFEISDQENANFRSTLKVLKKNHKNQTSKQIENYKSTLNSMKISNQNLNNKISQYESDMISKQESIRQLTKELKDNKDISIDDYKKLQESITKLDNLIAEKCPNLPKTKGKLYDNIVIILQKLSGLNNDRKIIHEEKKKLQKENKEIKKNFDNYKFQHQKDVHQSRENMIKLQTKITDMKYELDKEKESQIKLTLIKTRITDQLAKNDDKVKNLQSQLIKQDEILQNISEKDDEINNLKKKLTLKDDEISEFKNMTKIPSNLKTGVDQMNKSIMNTTCKMKDKIRIYAMKEGSLERKYFNFETLVIIDKILEKVAQDIFEESNIDKRVERQKIMCVKSDNKVSNTNGKSFSNLTMKEKKFLRPDLFC